MTATKVIDDVRVCADCGDLAQWLECDVCEGLGVDDYYGDDEADICLECNGACGFWVCVSRCDEAESHDDWYRREVAGMNPDEQF